MLMLTASGRSVAGKLVTLTPRLLLQSSSPSYLLMASLDGARAHAQQQGIWEEPLRAGQLSIAKLQEHNGLQVVSSAYVGECCYR